METAKTIIETAVSEARPTNIAGFINKLRSHPDVEKIVDVHGMRDGMDALIRTKDGNAYELQIRPAEYSRNQPKTKKRR